MPTRALFVRPDCVLLSSHRPKPGGVWRARLESRAGARALLLGGCLVAAGCVTSLSEVRTDRGLEPEPDRPVWHLQLDGEASLVSASGPTPARIFGADSLGLWLIDWPSSEDWLVDQKRGTVSLIDDARFDGAKARVPRPITEAPHAPSVAVTGTTKVVARAPIGVTKVIDGRLRLVTLAGIFEIAARPPLEGAFTGEEILDLRPAYRYRLESYRPDRDAIVSLRSLASGIARFAGAATGSGEPAGVEIAIAFGSWCPACAHFLPYCLRIEKELQGSSIRWTYVALAAPREGERQPVAISLGIDRVPTALVRLGEVELGRIVGPDGFRAFERRLADLLESASATPL